VDPYTKRKAEAEFKRSQERGVPPAPVAQAPANGALDDKALAANMLAQAQRMESEAKGLIAEAARMKKEAQRMHPTVTAKAAAAVIPTTTADASTAKKRGRPSKVAVENAVQ
jgi:hypothetical protein